MKTILTLCIGVALTIVALAQTSPQQDAAIREFPALAVQGSHFNKRFLERLEALRTANDTLLNRPDWPVVLARQIGLELGVEPVKAATTASRTSDPAPAPNPQPSSDGPAKSMTAEKMSGYKNPLDAKAIGDSAKRFRISGTVVRNTGDGLLVQCSPEWARQKRSGYAFANGLIYVTGATPMNVYERINVVGTYKGKHEYTTGAGPQQIDAYEVLGGQDQKMDRGLSRNQ